MRITPEQINVLDVYTRHYFGEDTGIWLFGSRVDDSKKGGDYDFLVETSLSDADEIIERKIALLTKLQSSSYRFVREYVGVHFPAVGCGNDMNEELVK